MRSSETEDFSAAYPSDFSQCSPDDPDVAWYYIPIQNGKPTWVDPFIDATIDVYMVSYTAIRASIRI